jgi:hypothetical protein
VSNRLVSDRREARAIYAEMRACDREIVDHLRKKLHVTLVEALNAYADARDEYLDERALFDRVVQDVR